MKKIRYMFLSRFFLFALVAMVGMSAASRCGTMPAMDAKYFFLSGNELRIILETTVHHQSLLPDAPTRTSDSKGWLVCVDLSSNKPLKNRARVCGPLWDT